MDYRDRKWYDDDQTDMFLPFENISQDFVDKREKQLQQAREKPRMSAKQRQIK